MFFIEEIFIHRTYTSNKKSIGFFIILTVIFLFFYSLSYAFDKTITIPAEKSEGVVLELPAGEYTAEISGGAICLFFPIHPNYQWIWGLAIGTDVSGGQDCPNIGTLYFEPKEKVFTQTEAEESALKAKADRQTGASLSFSLKENKEVRFWVSDFDYSDNSGSEKVRVYKKQGTY